MSVKFSKPMVFPESWHARHKRDKAKLAELKKGRRILAENSEAVDATGPTISLKSPEGDESSLKYHTLLVGLNEKKVTY
jgi:hypothetical protein